MYKLHFTPGTCSAVAHFALLQTGRDFEALHVSFKDRQQKSEAFLKINPQGKVPVLVVGDQVLTQVMAICLYLHRAHPAAKLFPNDDLAFAQALSLFANFNNTVHPTFTRYFRCRNYASTDEGASDVRSTAALAYRDCMAQLDSLMAGRDHVINQVSPLDAYLVTLHRWAGTAKVDLSPYTELNSAVDLIGKHPVYQQMLAHEKANTPG